jgi:hypothetical protein
MYVKSLITRIPSSDVVRIARLRWTYWDELVASVEQASMHPTGNFISFNRKLYWGLLPVRLSDADS